MFGSRVLGKQYIGVKKLAFFIYLFFFSTFAFTWSNSQNLSYFVSVNNSEKVIRTLAHELHHFKLDKSELGWHLEELEALAQETPEDEEEEESEEESDDDSDDSDDSSDDSDSDDDSEDEEEEEEGEKIKEKKEEDSISAKEDEDESIFMHEGPRPKIIEL